MTLVLGTGKICMSTLSWSVCTGMAFFHPSPVERLSYFSERHDCELRSSAVLLLMCREPAKFVAKLRENKTDKRILLFKCDLGAGHFSQSGRFDRLKDTAREYAFLLKCQDLVDT